MAKKNTRGGGRRNNNRNRGGDRENRRRDENTEEKDVNMDGEDDGEETRGDYAAEKALAEQAAKYEGKLVFRNYTPRDPVLRKLKLKKLSIPPIVDQITKELKNVELNAQTNVLTLAPKKPNWDLKRDAARKLEKLERRTQRAIYDLIREKLEAEGNGADNLAAAVEAGTKDMSYENVD